MRLYAGLMRRNRISLRCKIKKGETPERRKEMELNFLKTQNGIAEWEDLGDRLYRGRTKDGKEVIAKTEHEEGWDDEETTAIIYDDQPGDACEMCGVLHGIDELINADGEFLCSECHEAAKKYKQQYKNSDADHD